MKPPLLGEKIGSGLQYHVYAAGEGRVLKKVRPLKERLAVCNDWGKRHLAYKGKRALIYAKKGKNDLIYSLHQLKRNSNRIDQALIGHPIFLAHNAYEQDRVIPLNKYFAIHTLKENKQIMGKFVTCVLET